MLNVSEKNIYLPCFRRQTQQHTNPVEAGFSAELVGPRGAKVIVRPEGLVERGDEVEKSLPATLVTQGVLPVITALPQPAQKHNGEGN